MTPATKSLSKWSLPLLASLLAACGGSSSVNNGDYGSSGSTTQSGGSTTPVVGEYLNASGCAVRYRLSAPATQRTGTDPLLRQQWHLNNTGQVTGATSGEDLRVQGAWAAGKGAGIRVAVIDDAVEVTHNDLFPNIVAGGSYNYRSYGFGSAYPMPCDTADTHGTAVAGVIAARDGNGIGVSGVAPRASLVGLNAIATGEDQHLLHALTHDNDKNHIYNNSWGAQDDGHFYSAPTWMRTTLTEALKSGRQGLGSIFVFAAGNGGCMSGDPEDCESTEMSNYDGHVSLLGTMAICATNAQGKRAAYSEPGANLLVCAPSADLNSSLPQITTTTIKDENYTNGFNGTSAATPMVSGVVALMLEANPNLSWRDVRLVLAHTARQVDPTSASWTRFGTLNYSHEYGFGVVDASAAVQQARTWTSVGGSSTLKQCGPYTQSTGGAIPESATTTTAVDYNARATGGLISTIAVPDSCAITQIEHVEVNLKTTAANSSAVHPDASNLHVTLTSPSNQTSTLMTPHNCYNISNGSAAQARCDGLQDFTVGLTRHMDEPAATASNRTWTLEAIDRKAGETGQLGSWSLTIYGR